jgi:hypothetical protein
MGECRKKIALMIVSINFSEDDHENRSFGMDSLIEKFIIPHEKRGYEIEVFLSCSDKKTINNYDRRLKKRIKMKKYDPEKQHSKMCNLYAEMEHDHLWYVKYRPEMIFLEEFDIEKCSKDKLSTRARYYTGPKRLKYGGSCPKHCVDEKTYVYSKKETRVIMSDQFYVVPRKISDRAFKRPKKKYNGFEAECYHTGCFSDNGVKFNIIDVNFFEKKLKPDGKLIEWYSTPVNWLE